MYNTIFYIIVAIIIVNYLLERFLSYLNSTLWSAKLPEELNGVYNDEEYRKSQEYKRENNKFGTLTSTFSFLLILSILYFKGFAVIDTWARNITDNPLWITLIFFGILMFASDLLNTPYVIQLRVDTDLRVQDRGELYSRQHFPLSSQISQRAMLWQRKKRLTLRQ